MASKSSLPEEDLSCPVCCEIFKDPVVLSCSHSVCKTCLEKFWAVKKPHECPVCKGISSEDKPLLNRALKNVCEFFVESRGQRCEAECEELCSLHKEKLKLFCLGDQEPVCVVCQTSKEHKSHNFCPANEAVTDNKNKLQKALKPLQRNLQIFKEAKRGYERTADHIKTQAQNTERRIKEEFEKIHRFLRDEEAARLAALKEEEEQKSQIMKRKIEEINLEISSLSHKIEDIKKEMDTEDIPFLQNIKSTLAKTEFTPKNPETTSGSVINVAKHLSNLIFTVWEEMKKILHYTPVTLDPNTAHPLLHLSDDLTAVVFRDEKSLPDNLERFSSHACVLGSVGFNSGTHCWDVQVGNSAHWELGVTTGSATRKGLSFRDSTWSLEYSQSSGTFWARSPGQSDHSLQRKKMVQTVEVQLNWDKGKVTFTDLLTKTRLYTLKHTFTESVFPFFCNWDICPLRILPVESKVNSH